MNKALDSLHTKILNSKFAEEVTQEEIMALVKAKNNGWIPCSERLPELGQTCLLTVNRRNYPDAEHDVIFCSYVHVFHLSRFNDWCTAWMPLPAPFVQVATNAEWKQHILNRFEGGSV